MNRYHAHRNYSAGLTGEVDWAVYDRHASDPDTPIAVFARKGDALAFRKMKAGVGNG